jgi:hypothetical protein
MPVYSSHTLPTPLILHPNLHRRLRELLLRLALAVRLVLLARSITAYILLPAPSIHISTKHPSTNVPAHNKIPAPRFGLSLLLCLLAVGRLHVQQVLFAGGVVGVRVLAFGLAAGVS